MLMYGERRRCTDIPKGYARGKEWLGACRKCSGLDRLSLSKSSRTVNEYGYLVDTIAKRRGAIASLHVFWATFLRATGEVCPKEPLPVKVSKARSVRCSVGVIEICKQ